jgi:solute:Na+ symporter, SSS family
LNPYLLTLVAYSVLLVLLGVFRSRQVHDVQGFFVASRGLNTGLLFSTLLAANIGAGSKVGAAGLGYQFGLSAWWWVGSAGFGSLLLAFTVAPRLWQIASAHGFITVGDYLEYRYDRRIRGLAAILVWLGALAILAGQLIAVAWILDVVVALPKWLGCLLGGIVATTYFSVGGLFSTVWVNVVQVVVKMAGFVLAVLFALSLCGGWKSITERLAETSQPSLNLTSYLSFTGAEGFEILDYLVLLVPSFLVSPGILQKVYGAKDRGTARNGVLANAFALLLFAILPPVLGIAARAFYPDLPNRELAIPAVMVHLLPPWLGGLALAAIFSAELSAADAVLAMLSTSFARDLLKGYLVPNLRDSSLLAVTRVVAVLAGAAGVMLAVLLPNVVAALQIFYGLLTTALFVPLVFGLYWKKPDARAALAAIIAGVGTTLSLEVFNERKGIGILSPVACGIVLAAAMMWLVTVFSREQANRNTSSWTT